MAAMLQRKTLRLVAYGGGRKQQRLTKNGGDVMKNDVEAGSVWRRQEAAKAH